MTITGTALPLSTTDEKAAWVSIQANLANTGLIYVGGPGLTASNGNVLEKGDEYTFPYKGPSSPYDLDLIFVLSSVSGDGVTGNKADA